MFTSYEQRLIENRKVLNNTAKWQYLTKFLTMYKGKYKKRLEALYNVAESTEKREAAAYGDEWFYDSERHMAELAGTDWKTLHYSIVLFACVGLIKRLIPTQETASSQRQENSVAIAQSHGDKWNAIAYYAFSTYKPEQMNYIDGKLKIWFDNGKPAIISRDKAEQIWGQHIANRVFHSYNTHSVSPNRSISRATQQHLNELQQAFSKALEEIARQGYSHKGTVIHSLKTFYYDTDETLRAKELKQSAEGQQFLMREKEKKAERIWRQHGQLIMKENNLAYRQQRREDTEKYDIAEQDKRWVICKNS